MIFPREKRSHTPGPWEYFQGAICFGRPDERMVLCTPHLHQGTPEKDCILMAAAPDLLRVAELVVQATIGNIPPGIVEEARRGHQKSEGHYMTKPQEDSYEVAEEKVLNLKTILSSFWAHDLRRAWDAGFDAGRNSVEIVPVVKRPKNKKRVRSQEGKAAK